MAKMLPLSLFKIERNRLYATVNLPKSIPCLCTFVQEGQKCTMNFVWRDLSKMWPETVKFGNTLAATFSIFLVKIAQI